MKLDPADYWQLRTLTSDLRQGETQLMLMQQQLESLRKKRQEHWEKTAIKYELDVTKAYDINDDDCSLEIRS